MPVTDAITTPLSCTCACPQSPAATTMAVARAFLLVTLCSATFLAIDGKHIHISATRVRFSRPAGLSPDTFCRAHLVGTAPFGFHHRCPGFFLSIGRRAHPSESQRCERRASQAGGCQCSSLCQRHCQCDLGRRICRRLCYGICSRQRLHTAAGEGRSGTYAAARQR